jgi:hypothetical protein
MEQGGHCMGATVQAACAIEAAMLAANAGCKWQVFDRRILFNARGALIRILWLGSLSI